MEPEREHDLVELIDRLLNKGLVVNADLIISVAGVPLIGVNLKAALASIETMIDYGMMEAWDRSTREWCEEEHRARMARLLAENEELLLRVPGSLLTGNDSFWQWKPGFWHVTDSRLLLRCGDETAFEKPLEAIETVIPLPGEQDTKGRRQLLLDCEDGQYRASVRDPEELKEAIEKACVRRRERLVPVRTV